MPLAGTPSTFRSYGLFCQTCRAHTTLRTTVHDGRLYDSTVTGQQMCLKHEFAFQTLFRSGCGVQFATKKGEKYERMIVSLYALKRYITGNLQ